QNALGPEQAPQLGVIRTEELLRATQQYGVRLFFTRAADFGYSKTAEETLRIWGDAARDDMVEVLLHFRPHIIINNWGGVRGGHGQHQAAGLLVPRALEEAARRDAARLSRNQSDSRFTIPDARASYQLASAQKISGRSEISTFQGQTSTQRPQRRRGHGGSQQSDSQFQIPDARASHNLRGGAVEWQSRNPGNSEFHIPGASPSHPLRRGAENAEAKPEPGGSSSHHEKNSRTSSTEWPWAETVVFNLARGGAQGNAIALPTDDISPLWGKSYNEIGLEGFVNHRTQGIVGFRGSRFFRGRRTLAPAQAQLMSAVPIRAAKDAAIERAIDAAERLDWPAAARQLA
ncbi:MAG: hypothetical protein ACRD5F_11240, partial [Candidatus Acidiferrales bacterium]